MEWMRRLKGDGMYEKPGCAGIEGYFPRVSPFGLLFCGFGCGGSEQCLGWRPFRKSHDGSAFDVPFAECGPQLHRGPLAMVCIAFYSCNRFGFLWYHHVFVPD